jgi:hypothetical protein
MPVCPVATNSAPECACQLERRRHLADVAVAADRQHHQRLERGGASGRERGIRRRAAHVDQSPAEPVRQLRELRIVGEEAMQSRDHVPAVRQRIAHQGAPALGQHAARRGDADQQRAAPARGGRLEIGDHRNVAANAHALRRAAPGMRGIQHRRHALRAIAQNSDGGFRVLRGQAAFGQKHQRPLGIEHVSHPGIRRPGRIGPPSLRC